MFAHSNHNFPPSPHSNPTEPNSPHLNDSPTVKRLETYFAEDISQLFSSMPELNTPTNLKSKNQRDTKKSDSFIYNKLSTKCLHLPSSQSTAPSPPISSLPTSTMPSSATSPTRTKSAIAKSSTPNTKRKPSPTRSPFDTPKKNKKSSSPSSEDNNPSLEFDPNLKLKLMDLSDDMLQSTPPKHLAQILALRVRADDKLLHFKSLLSLTDDQIRTKAIRVRDLLMKRSIKTIQATTRDSTIKGLSIQSLRATFKNVTKHNGKTVDESTLSSMSPDNLITSLLTHRDTLKQTTSTCTMPDDTNSTNPDVEMTDTTSDNDPDTQPVPPSSHSPKKCDDNSNITAFTSDSDISNMSFDNLRTAYYNIRMKSSEPISMGGLTLYSQEELCDLIQAYRNTLQDIQQEIENSLDDSKPSTDQSSTNTETDAPPTPTREPDDTSSPSHDDHEDTSKTANESTQSTQNPNIVEMNKISIRPKVFKSRLEGTFPELARTYFAKMREWDSDMCIIPFDNSAQNVINHESHIPDEMEQADVWIRNTIDHDKWKYFTFQIRTTKSRDYIRGKIYRWMSEIKCYTKVDLISSDKTACLGFFANLHPEFHNRDKLMCHIHEYLTNELQQATYVSVFTRPIHAGKGNDRDSTSAVVIEVAQAEASIIGDKLYKLPLDTYSDVMFVPFTKLDKVYASILKTVVKTHDKFIYNVEELNIPPLRFCASFLSFSGELKSIRDIILSYNTPECQFIHDVDVDRKGGTSIIYNLAHEDKCRDFLENLQELLQTNLTEKSLGECLQGKIDVDRILKPSKAKMARATIRHSRSVRSKFGKSSQNSSPSSSPTPANHVSYATAVSASAATFTLTNPDNNPKLPENIQAMIDDAVHTKISQSQPSPVNDTSDISVLPENIQTMINDAIETKLSKLPSSQQSQEDVETLIEKAVNEKFSPYDTRLMILEETPIPEIPTIDSFKSTITTEIQNQLQPIDDRVGVIETSFGSHTAQSNKRLHSLEEIIKKQDLTLNKFMAAMMAPNNHIPAINSNCRVVAKIV